VVVTGYFGERLAVICERYGAVVSRLEVEWGRACNPGDLDRALRAAPADLVAVVHAETSTGVLNPVERLAPIARDRGALVLVDAVTSFGGHRVDMADWGIDVCYSCTQKCLGAPSGLAPIVFGPRALARLVPCRSFYFDLQLLRDYWLRHVYHHTMSSALVCALAEALAAFEEEGLEARWARHRRSHRALVEGLGRMGLSLLPPEGERLWTVNAVCVPEGVAEDAVRLYLINELGIEIGAGLGPLAGKIWRIGLMGASSSPQLALMLLGALERALTETGRHHVHV
jgi:alanine-glyoxylate transaminase/serine-glyoxylate transaminase/serine-pyruvate transaminase